MFSIKQPSFEKNFKLQDLILLYAEPCYDNIFKLTSDTLLEYTDNQLMHKLVMTWLDLW